MNDLKTNTNADINTDIIAIKSAIHDMIASISTQSQSNDFHTRRDQLVPQMQSNIERQEQTDHHLSQQKLDINGINKSKDINNTINDNNSNTESSDGDNDDHKQVCGDQHSDDSIVPQMDNINHNKRSPDSVIISSTSSCDEESDESSLYETTDEINNKMIVTYGLDPIRVVRFPKVDIKVGLTRLKRSHNKKFRVEE